MKKLTPAATVTINGGGLKQNMKKLTSVETITINGGGMKLN